VVDDDQPKRIVKAEREAASRLLSKQVRSLREIDGIECDYIMALGNAFEGIAKAAEETGCDLVVIGPHRRQALSDVFVGTTAERTIRSSSRPILMANGVPAEPYRHALVAVDLSACSADALLSVTALGLQDHAAVSVVHVIDVPGSTLMSRSLLTEDQVQNYLLDVQERASVELGRFLMDLKFEPIQQIVKHNVTSIGSTIGEAARAISADLIVVGTRGRTGLAKLLLGSVAEEVLRRGDCDVLAIPPSAGRPAIENG